MKRQFIISSELFQGFKMEIDDEEMTSMDDIIKKIQTRLIHDMEQIGLNYLMEQAIKRKFHHHSYHFIDILQNNDPNKIWYICDHC